MNKAYLLLVSAGIASACGPAPTGPSTVSGTAPPATAAAAAEPCPAGDALIETARAAWGKGPGEIYADCVALRAGGETLWLVDGTFDPGGDSMTMGMWTALVTPAGEVRWSAGDDELPYGAMMRTSSAGWTAADLDGDGTDEVLYETTYDHGGYLDSQLLVGRIAGGELVVAEGVPLSSDNSAADVDEAEMVVCSGAWEVVGNQVAVTYDGPSCERPGRHLMSWNGTALAPAGP